jgi:hypothetical protein
MNIFTEALFLISFSIYISTVNVIYLFIHSFIHFLFGQN